MWPRVRRRLAWSLCGRIHLLVERGGYESVLTPHHLGVSLAFLLHAVNGIGPAAEIVTVGEWFDLRPGGAEEL